MSPSPRAGAVSQRRLRWTLVALAALTLCSALTLGWNTYYYRDRFATLESAQLRAAALEARWRELSVEWSTLSEPALVRSIAQAHLALRAPTAPQTEQLLLPSVLARPSTEVSR